MSKHLTEVQLHHISEMFSSFAPAYAERWNYLLDRSPERWSKISPFDIWPTNGSKNRQDNSNWAEMANQHAREHMEKECVLFLCGHSMPIVKTDTLRHLISQHQNYLEGFISIIPGRLAFAMNHDGETLLMKNKKEK
jgi:carbonic anhydrase